MPGGGTRTFLEPDQYEASLRQAQIEAVMVPRGKFKARLTWAELHRLQVLRCEEDSARVAYVQLAPGLASVTFPEDSQEQPVWRGREMQAAEIVFHSRAERLHQATPGPSVWNVITMDPAQLERYGRALSGKPFPSHGDGRVLQPSPRLTARLRRLHAQICRLAETKSKILSHSEVARAMEQGLIQALVEVAPVSWTPDYLGSRSPRWARQEQPTRLSSAARWLSWCAPAGRRRSWRVSSNRQHSRSGTGWHSVSVTPAGATAA